CMPRPDDPVTIPKEPGDTSIPLDDADVHQLLSSGSAPSSRPPSAQLSSTITAADVALVSTSAAARARAAAAWKFLALSNRALISRTSRKVGRMIHDPVEVVVS